MMNKIKPVVVLLLISISAAAQSQTALDDQVKPIVVSFKGKHGVAQINADQRSSA
jgi:hypothetical protein